MATQTTIDVVMPQMGDSVTEGTILEWHVQEGGTVAADDILVEISTDKVDAEMPSPASGTLVEILAQNGEDVQVGQVLGRIEISDSDGAIATADGHSGGEDSGDSEVVRPAGRDDRRGHRPRRSARGQPAPTRPMPAARSTRSSRRAAASPSPRPPSWTGSPSRAPPSPTAIRSSRSRPTRSTWSSPRPAQAC